MTFSGQAGKRTLRRYAVWVLATTAMIVAAYYLVRPLSVEYVAQAEVSVVPFTLLQHFYSHYDQNPDGRLELQMTVARRTDGATVGLNKDFLESGAPGGSIRVVDLPDGRESVAYDDVASVVRLPQPPAWVVAMQKESIVNRPSNCVSPGQTLEGYDRIQEYRVAVVEWPQTASGIRYTAWEAPELGCQTLQSLAEAKQPDGSYSTVGKTELVSVTMGEPDPNLFQVPGNYQAVMPSVALHEEFAHLGSPWTEQLEKTARAQDASYLKHASGQWGSPPKSQMFQQPPSARSPGQ